jgi:hypothetical protein
MKGKASERAGKLASLYCRGVLTGTEVVIEFVLLAAEEAPATLAATLPADLLGEVREQCRRPPADPSKSPRIFGIGVSDPEAWRRWTSQAWYDGARAWHRYFET